MHNQIKLLADETFTITPPGAGISYKGVGGSAEGAVGVILKNGISLLFVAGGIGVLVYFIWGAVEWILSGGDKEKVASARKRMTHAVIGLALLSLSYFIIGVVGTIVGFNPLNDLQIPGLGCTDVAKGQCQR